MRAGSGRRRRLGADDVEGIGLIAHSQAHANVDVRLHLPDDDAHRALSGENEVDAEGPAESCEVFEQVGGARMSGQRLCPWRPAPRLIYSTATEPDRLQQLGRVRRLARPLLGRTGRTSPRTWCRIGSRVPARRVPEYDEQKLSFLHPDHLSARGRRRRNESRAQPAAIRRFVAGSPRRHPRSPRAGRRRGRC